MTLLIALVLILLFICMASKENMLGGKKQQKNILGKKLEVCSTNPLTGFYRDGYCNTGADDLGTHTVCAKVTDEFLDFTKSKGNDLSTPSNNFPGLKDGDKWCLCAMRWKQAKKEGKAPPVILEATNEATNKYVSMEV